MEVELVCKVGTQEVFLTIQGMKELGIKTQEEFDEAVKWHFMNTQTKLDNINQRLKKIEKILEVE